MSNNKAISFFFLILQWITIKAKIACDPESFHFISPPVSIPYNKLYTFKIENREEIGCAINATYLWQISQTYFDRVIYLDHYHILKIPTLTQSKINVVNFKSAYTSADIFGNRYNIKVTLFPRPTHYPSYRVHEFSIDLEKYTIYLHHGMVYIHQLGQGSLYLNVSIVRETGRPPNYKSIKWDCEPPFLPEYECQGLLCEVLEMHLVPNSSHACKCIISLKDGRQFQQLQRIIILEMKERPLIEIRCVENCDDGNPYKETILKFVCHANCGNKPVWATDPYDANLPKKFIYSGKNDLLHIPPGIFTYGTTRNILAIIGNIVARFSLVYGLPNASLSINCTRNCYLRHKPMTFEAICDGDCEEAIFFWEVTPLHKTWNFSHLTFDNKSKITFPPFTFPPSNGANLMLRYSIYNASLTFEVAQYSPKVKISCTSNGKTCEEELPHISKEVAIAVKCLNECDVPPFHWSLNPPIKYRERILELHANYSIVIPPKSYDSGTSVNALLFVDDVVFVDSYSFKYRDPPVLEIICQKNCHPEKTNPFDSVFLRVNCTGPCEVTYKWSLQPRSDNIETNVDLLKEGTMLFIPSYMYSNGTLVNVTVSADGANATYSMMYFINPVIRLFCIRNCFEPRDRNLEVVYEARCYADCEGIEYNWDIEPEHSRELWHDKISLGDRNKTIIIKAGVFENKEKMRLKLYIHSDDPEHTRYTYLTFTQVMPILYMECTENCNSSWTHLPVKIAVRCIAYCFNLTYEWDFKPKGELTHLYKFSTWNEDKSVLTVLPFIFSSGEQINFTVSASNVATWLLVEFEELESVLAIVCTPKVCERPQDIKDEVTLTATCVKHCFRDQDTYIWRISPLTHPNIVGQPIIRGPNNDSLVFAPGVLSGVITLNVSLSRGTAKTHTEIFFHQVPPQFRIVCTNNCNHSNPHQSVTLETKCYIGCDTIKDYVWNFDLPPNVTYFDFWGLVKTSPKHKEVVIPPNLYQDGDIIFVDATVSGVYSSRYTLAYVEPKPNLVISCVRNCWFDPLQDTILEVDCANNCVVPHEYEWNFIVGDEQPQFYNRKKALLLPARSYEEQTSIEFSACKGKGCTSRIITFVQPQAELILTCTENCYPNGTANPKVNTRFEVNCTRNCNRTIDYFWYIKPTPLFFDVDKNVTFGHNKQSLTIHAGLYLNETCILVKVTSGNGTKSINLCFHQPPPVFKVICWNNCGYPNPKFDVYTFVYCFSNCDGVIFDWFVTPGPREFSMETNTQLADEEFSIIIKGYTYEDGEKARIIASYAQDESSIEYHYTVPAPKIEIQSFATDNKVNPYDDLTLNAICLEHCQDHYIEWKMLPLNVSKPEEVLMNTEMDISENKSSLTILGESFVNGSVVAIAAYSNKSAMSKVYVHYHYDPPLLEIICTLNCRFNPTIPVVLKVECSGVCHEFVEDLICHSYVLPTRKESHELPLVGKNEVTVPAIYREKVEVEVKCRSLNSETSMVLKFKRLPWNGTCSIMPTSGISGITLHSIECAYFLGSAMYYVYQKEDNYAHGFGMRLVISKRRFIPHFYLAPTNPSGEVIVHIGIGWKIRGKVSLPVMSVTLVDATLSKVFNTTAKDYFSHLFGKLKHYNEINKKLQAFQIAYIIVKNTQYLSQSDGVPLNHELVNFYLDEMVLAVEPSQSLLLIQTILLTYMKVGIASIRNILTIIRLTLEIVPFWNASRMKYDIINYQFIGNTSIFLLETIIKESYRLTTNYFTSPHLQQPAFEEEPFTNETFRTIYYKMHLRKIVTDILFTLEEAFKFVTGSSLYNIEYHGGVIKFIIRRIPTNGPKSFKISHPHYQTFVLFDPTSFAKTDNYISVRFALIIPNLFWWNSDINNISSGLAYFQITDINSNALETRFRVFMEMYDENPYARWNSNHTGYSILQVHAPINYTLEIVAERYIDKLFIAKWKPTKNETIRLGTTIVISGVKFLYVRRLPIYLGVIHNRSALLAVTARQCLDYHDGRWNRSNCTVFHHHRGKKFVGCRCSRMSLFSADIQAPQLEVVRREKVIKKQYNVLLIFGFIIAITIILMIIAAAAALAFDIMHKKSAKICQLKDNDPYDKVFYIIEVQTGLWISSGTTSKITIQLLGTLGSSKPHVLNARDDKLLQRNRCDFFVLQTPKSLGEMKYLHLWNNYNGSRPNWYCDSVVVRSVATRKSYVFLVHRWFALVKPPFTLKGTFLTKANRRRVPFSGRIAASLRRNHNFIGILTNNRTSNSIRNNVLVSIAVISVTMATCATIITYSHCAERSEYLIVIFYSALWGSLAGILLDIFIRKTKYN